LGKAHGSRFVCGYFGDAQDLWKQAREVIVFFKGNFMRLQYSFKLQFV
jgi:hypothetical protein